MGKLRSRPEVRHEAIFNYVRGREEITISELAALLIVSTRTIRRDITDMQELEQYRGRIETKLGRGGCVCYIPEMDSSAKFLSEMQKEAVGFWAFLTLDWIPPELQEIISVVLKRLGIKPRKEVPQWLQGIKNGITG